MTTPYQTVNFLIEAVDDMTGRQVNILKHGKLPNVLDKCVDRV